MNTQPLVSIPMFTYNGEKFLVQQLESIYAQSYENIEVIACDDGSSDATLTILERYHASHGLKIYVNPRNIGVAKNVAMGLALCSGEYIAPSDQDDIWEPDKIKLLMENIGENALIYSLSTPIDEKNRLLKDFTLTKDAYVEGQNSLSLIMENCVSGHTMLFKKDLLSYLKEFPNAIYPDWWIAFVASCYGNLAFINQSLVKYRRHEAQMTRHQVKTKSNFFTKIYKKEKTKKKHVQEKINRLKYFANFEILDPKINEFLALLIHEYQQFDKHYYNKELEQLLLSKKEELFLIQLTQSSKIIKKECRGIWYYRFRLYT